MWIHFFSMMILLIYFGQNQGAHLSYHLQLGLPGIIILAMRALNWLLNCERIKGEWLRNGIRLIALVCAIYPAWWLKTPELTKDDLGLAVLGHDGRVCFSEKNISGSIGIEKST